MTIRTRITPTTLVRSSDMGRTATVCGVTLATMVSSADTATVCALLHVTLPPHWEGCPPHRHVHTTEVIYVLHGTLACTLDDITATASDGTTMLIPPGVVHTMWNPTATPASYLAWFSPGMTPPEPVREPGVRQLGTTLSATDDVLLADPDVGDGPHAV